MPVCVRLLMAALLQDGTYFGLSDGAFAAASRNLTHLSLVKASGRVALYSNMYRSGASTAEREELSTRHVIVEFTELSSLSEPISAVFETQRLDRVLLQALANYQLNRTPKHAKALRQAAEMHALDLGDLNWDGDCQVESGLCLSPDTASE